MVSILAAVAGVWLLLSVLVIAMCAAAASGDRQGGPRQTPYEFPEPIVRLAESPDPIVRLAESPKN
jgi:hypothetical protein